MERAQDDPLRDLDPRGLDLGYDVWLAGRHVVYHGRRREQWIERFPGGPAARPAVEVVRRIYGAFVVDRPPLERVRPKLLLSPVLARRHESGGPPGKAKARIQRVVNLASRCSW